MMLLWPEVWAATYFEVASFKKSRLQAAETGGARARSSGRSIVNGFLKSAQSAVIGLFGFVLSVGYRQKHYNYISTQVHSRSTDAPQRCGSHSSSHVACLHVAWIGEFPGT